MYAYVSHQEDSTTHYHCCYWRPNWAVHLMYLKCYCPVVIVKWRKIWVIRWGQKIILERWEFNWLSNRLIFVIIGDTKFVSFAVYSPGHPLSLQSTKRYVLLLKSLSRLKSQNLVWHCHYLLHHSLVLFYHYESYCDFDITTMSTEYHQQRLHYHCYFPCLCDCYSIFVSLWFQAPILALIANKIFMIWKNSVHHKLKWKSKKNEITIITWKLSRRIADR